MPITHPIPPTSSMNVLVGHVVPVHLASDEILDMPHQVFDVDAEDLRAGRGLDAAKLTGWRYVTRSVTGEYRVVEIGVDETAGDHTFHFVNAGDHVDNLVALHDDGPAAVIDKDYELSVLRAPGCQILALWFTGVDDGHEFLVPLAPAHGNVVPNISYEADEFTTVLQTTARQMTGGSPRPRGGAGDGVDFTLIEGIGPQIAELLVEGGIVSFAQLAGTTASDLEVALRRGGARFNRADPSSWPEQAALAAAGRWEDLDALQRRLTGGR